MMIMSKSFVIPVQQLPMVIRLFLDVCCETLLLIETVMDSSYGSTVVVQGQCCGLLLSVTRFAAMRLRDSFNCADPSYGKLCMHDMIGYVTY